VLGIRFDHRAVRLCEDLQPPRPGPGWSRIRVHKAGICATDRALLGGYMGFTGVPGHEFVGTAIDGPHAGRRVTGDINAGCGTCALCQGGDPRHCTKRTVLGILGAPGAFAEMTALPDGNLVPVPDSVSDDAATFAEPLAAALHILDDVDNLTGRRVLVAGDGKLGLLCAWAMADAGAFVTLAGRHPDRPARLGMDVEHVSGWLEPDGSPDARDFDVAVEATGNPDALGRLLPLLRPRGTLVLKTTSEAPSTADLSLAVVNELRIVGSRCGRVEKAIAALAEGRIPVQGLIDGRYPLSAAVAALAHAGQPGALKVLLEMTTDA
jgi:2-desacetyl-2-hydroxyethyl bacteriochlorophyllide A dehydrogenase